MGQYVYLMLNMDIIKVLNFVNNTIIFYLYDICQAFDKILNLKHEIRSFVYLKINKG